MLRWYILHNKILEKSFSYGLVFRVLSSKETSSDDELLVSLAEAQMLDSERAEGNCFLGLHRVTRARMYHLLRVISLYYNVHGSL